MLWNDLEGSGATLKLVPDEVTVPGCFGTGSTPYPFLPVPTAKGVGQLSAKPTMHIDSPVSRPEILSLSVLSASKEVLDRLPSRKWLETHLHPFFYTTRFILIASRLIWNRVKPHVTLLQAWLEHPFLVRHLVWPHSQILQSGAIIGDGDRKCALILLLGLSPWYGTIFLFLEQIAPSPVAHARTCCEDFCVCREGKVTSVITEMFDTFSPQQPTTQYVHVCWNFASVSST